MANKKKVVEVSKEELIEQSAKKLEQAKVEEEEREQYAKRLQEERIQLLRSKQGIEPEPENQTEEKPEIHYTTKQKISNFFYHYKLTIIIVSFFVFLGGYLIIETVTTKHPDINILIISEDYKLNEGKEAIEELITPYCTDYNNDGQVFVRVDYVPSYTSTDSSTEKYINQASQARIIAEFQNNNIAMMITDDESIEYLGITEDVFEDMRNYYPDDEYATQFGYKLKGTTIAKAINYTDMPDDYYISIRVPKDGFGFNYKEFTKRNEQAFNILNELVNK